MFYKQLTMKERYAVSRVRRYPWGANGLTREYFPKDKEFPEITAKEIVDV